jgi:hypothetical protein
MAALTDYLENKLIVQIFRGQAYAFPSTLYYGLLTAAPSDGSAGTEVSGGGYARQGVACTLANFAGTQGAGTTTASTGSTGTTSNNVAVTFPAVSASWGTVGWYGIWDASTGGNLLMWGALSASKLINLGEAQQAFAPGAAPFQIDS